MTVEHVDGKDKGKVMLYALSTCEWCRMTRELLTGLGIAFSYEYVDLLPVPEQRKIYEDFIRHKASWGFPVIVIGDWQKVIQGYREQDIRGALQ